MAHSDDNVLTYGLRGAIGRLVVFRKKGDKTIVSKRPRFKPGYVPTTDQLAIRDKFSDASRYAKAAIQDPATKAGYEAVSRSGQSAYNVAFQDAYNAPELSLLRLENYNGQPLDTILVKAVDNFKVVSVEFLISNPDGSLLERGLATIELNGSDWKYSCKLLNANLTGSVVKVVATDLPGNSVELSQTI